MPTKRRLLAAVVVVVVVTGALLAYYVPRLSTDGDGEELTLYGNVDVRDVQVAFKVSDRISKVLVEEGDRVQAGQLLARLDDTRFSERVAAQSAELEVRRQQLLALEHGSREEDIAQARGEVASLKAQVEVAGRDYERLASLLASQAISEQLVDDAKARRDGLTGQLAAAEASLARLVAGAREEDIAAARAAVAAADATLSSARTDLAETYLYAPADGVIQNRILEPGDMAGPQTPVFSLALTNPLWVRAYVPEPDLGRLRPGMPARITSDSYPGKEYVGWIGFISPTAEFTPKNVQTTDLRTRLVYRVRVMACDQNDELRLGMPVTVKVSLVVPVSPESPSCDRL